MKTIIKVAGIFVGVDQEKLNAHDLVLNEIVEIRPEENKYASDNLALAIYVRDFRIGFVPEAVKDYYIKNKILSAKINDISLRSNGNVYGVRVEVEDEKKEPLILRPEILTHPNIPKPLHGINPRTIKGDVWWNKTRQEVYKSTNYHCIACGVHKSQAKRHQWLEAHEFYEIDHEKGTCTIKEIVPLCHYCHNFIHTGRLTAIIGKEKSKQEVINILEHGFKILSENKLKCYDVTLDLAQNVGEYVQTFGVESYDLDNRDYVKWGDWRMIFEDHEYRSNFQSIEDWQKYYSNK